MNCASNEVDSGLEEEVDWLAEETIGLMEDLLLFNSLCEDIDDGLEGCAGLVWETEWLLLVNAGTDVVDIGLVEKFGGCVFNTWHVDVVTWLVDSGLGTEPAGLAVDIGLGPAAAGPDGLVVDSGLEPEPAGLVVDSGLEPGPAGVVVDSGLKPEPGWLVVDSGLGPEAAGLAVESGGWRDNGLALIEADRFTAVAVEPFGVDNELEGNGVAVVTTVPDLGLLLEGTWAAIVTTGVEQDGVVGVSATLIWIDRGGNWVGVESMKVIQLTENWW